MESDKLTNVVDHPPEQSSGGGLLAQVVKDKKKKKKKLTAKERARVIGASKPNNL